MVAKSFEVGDLVWAKMKGYSPWPGKIAEIPPDQKSKPKKYHHYVYFFGSNNYAWIPDENIELHSEKLVGKYGNKKTGLYQTAVETIVECSKGVSKYNKSSESSEMLVKKNSSETKEQGSNHDKFANKDVRSKNKSLQSNNTPPKRMKKLPLKKLSSVKKLSLVKKPARKRTHSPDQIKPSNHPTGHYLQTISDPIPLKNFKADDGYAELMSNVPPNLSYNTEGISLPPVSKLNVLERKYFERPDTPPIDLSYQSEILIKKKIEPTNKKIGFLGLDKMSQGIVKNLCHSGHSIIIWNQTPIECQDFADKFKDNILVAATPADVIEAADITFSCASDAETAKQIVFGNCGILRELEQRNGERKGYVEMTSMDPKISQAIGSDIIKKGGRYLEAPLCGSRIDANEGTLFIVAAGDETLYNDCKSCFDAVSKRHRFVGSEVGTAFNLGLIHNMLVATVYAAVAESLSLVSRIGLKGDDLLDMLKDGIINSENIVGKATSMLKSHYVSNTSLKQMQQDLNLGLLLGDKFAQPTPIFAAVNEVYKHCKSMRYGDHDVSAVFEGTKS